MIMSGTAVTFYINRDNTTIKPADNDFTYKNALDFTLVTVLGVITEIGAAVEFTGTNTEWDYEFDDIELVSGEGVPIDNSIIDGDTVKVSSIYVKKTIGQVGSNARITYHDPLFSLGPTVETAHRTVMTISETKFNTRMLQGEVQHTDTMTKEIIVEGVEKKLSRTIAAYDPVYTQGIVEYIDGNTLYKQDTGDNV